MGEQAILVVDDSDDDIETVCAAASRAGVTMAITSAPDADVALRLLDAAADGVFAFMLLDFNLPGVDGLTFLHQVRRHPVHARLPVVVLTASVNPRDRLAFLAAGADAFHIKTVRLEECLDTLTAIFKRWSGPTVAP
ncbi:response regulator [Actimicrobium sp. CCC2.4]|uniref:response regulator n=1 Tax=Actimicrobium sp. CCC2.4 TaxID=3048606 RepID=UPI002AC9433F|nr:response regulator [Actimicrobium sp. CCC2.4]MEB0135387.1 response regulator [Actimicrobium sp. CCC2.4]WPX32438.1 response regulator [Actimicrobium sp. CCC2.4]